MFNPRSMESAAIGNSTGSSSNLILARARCRLRFEPASIFTTVIISMPDDIVDAECRVRMGDRPADAGGEQIFAQQAPQGDYGAHFSTPFIAAVALLKGGLRWRISTATH